MSSKVIHALYNDDEVVLEAAKKVKAANHHIEEIFCPFRFTDWTRPWD
jgi:hypothetical protein